MVHGQKSAFRSGGADPHGPGHIRGALGSRVPLTHKGDEIDQLASTFNQMLDRIEMLVANIREMSDNIAHDLKSPVTRIRGIAEVTLTTDSSLTSYENMAASIIEECDRLLDMINTMLVISKTEAGVDKLNIEPLDMAEIVKDACNLFQSSAEDNGVALSYRLPEKLFVSGDKRMVQRMVANLLDNAIRYTPEGGAVEVTGEPKGQDRLAVVVKDTGIGISNEDLPHVFERFYRCEPSRSPAGTGLGLSLALAIARAHGGNIEVESVPGKGSIFTVILPKDYRPTT
ncbi:MAG: HAMP domain-containing sensor histidine kinase [Thermodesulfobacteriota bacterium]